MKRLQVGDECYVRNGVGELYRAKVTGLSKLGLCFYIPAIDRTEFAWSYDDRKCKSRLLWSLVYPYPIIKQLAK